ncbi:MAG TPA: preprotein translocase subunit SecG [Chitinophagaceae bacterium]|nr:preprotein translocase subunit SecG [Chitinophagaceae bacterium]
MTTLFFILIIIVCALVAFVVLIQNPKGGGLSGTFGGFGNQVMGVKQTTDVLEKGTWLFAGILAFLCIISSLFFTGTTETEGSQIIKGLNTNSPQQAQPNNTITLPAQQDSGKK